MQYNNKMVQKSQGFPGRINEKYTNEKLFSLLGEKQNIIK